MSSSEKTLELSSQELLALAMKMHREGRTQAARECYEGLLAIEPDNANAVHFFGILQYQVGEKKSARALIERSVELDPLVASWFNNLGNVLLDDGEFEAAAKAYVRCSELDPANLQVLNNMGVLSGRLKRPGQAEAYLLRALEQDRDFADAHINLGNLYLDLNRNTEAFSHFADALALKPLDNQVRGALTVAYGQAQRIGEGKRFLQEWLALEPDNPRAQHFWAAFGGTPLPERASDSYVVAEFDGFADSFDAKLAHLDYRAPTAIVDAVARHLGAALADQCILDAGCGTGLCAPGLRPYASQLVGVDLSGNMLKHARARSLYDELVQGELVAFLTTSEPRFDIIVSADTLCYFGALEAVFSSARKAMRAGGRLFFTVEAHDEDKPVLLHPHGRFSHSKAYVTSTLLQCGFAQCEANSLELRTEGGAPVSGWLFCAC